MNLQPKQHLPQPVQFQGNYMLRFNDQYTSYQDALDNVEGEGFHIKNHELIKDNAMVVEIASHQDDNFVKALKNPEKLVLIRGFSSIDLEPMKSNFEKAVTFFKTQLKFHNSN